jgi:hypothetical protein
MYVHLSCAQRVADRHMRTLVAIGDLLVDLFARISHSSNAPLISVCQECREFEVYRHALTA